MVRATPCLAVPDDLAWTRGLCQCGNDLPRRKDGRLNLNRRWCVPACGRDVVVRHHWGSANSAALRRNADCPEGPHCERCNLPRYRSDAGGRCAVLEVDHIVPLQGSYRSWTCANHPENLRVLCRPCHVDVTNAQRRARRAYLHAYRDAGLVAPPGPWSSEEAA